MADENTSEEDRKFNDYVQMLRDSYRRQKEAKEARRLKKPCNCKKWYWKQK